MKANGCDDARDKFTLVPLCQRPELKDECIALLNEIFLSTEDQCAFYEKCGYKNCDPIVTVGASSSLFKNANMGKFLSRTGNNEAVDNTGDYRIPSPSKEEEDAVNRDSAPVAVDARTEQVAPQISTLASPPPPPPMPAFALEPTRRPGTDGISCKRNNQFMCKVLPRK